ncbi:hypothetical protein B0J11DRAFT_525061 [Dendryphion nanum]|uniref:Protein kinase domain-containing protein n=1 Tax=Dendryphion nanum TaxID=256645 RepID=A0A9P9E069_9PLEO|nr:hypothetical protein B0J11DRAFT_525061 [Dendryphion nanum]
MADEDDWGFPIAPSNTEPAPIAGGDEEDDWGFPVTSLSTSQIAPTTTAVTKPSGGEDDEDEWGFSTTGLTKDAAPKVNKAPLNEDEWGFPTGDSAPPTTKNDAADLLAKWGFESEPSTPIPAPETSVPDASTAASSLFEGWKTATRTNSLSTSLSTFTTILSNLDIRGPQHLLYGLKDTAIKIGQGTQFTAFLDRLSAEAEDGSGKIVPGQGIVVKRVRISQAALDAQKDLSENDQYRQRLRQLELEVLSLGLLKHRNIVKLTGWGYDYEDRITPVPVLFMEAALIPLTEFLQAEKSDNDENRLAGLGRISWDVKYHLALDTAAGLEAIHRLGIVHGDVKPDNVLVFRGKDEKAPFVGKLSDFGVCIDMRRNGKEITPESYLGTDAWTGSEVGVGQWKDDVHGKFESEMLKKFDSYSYGLLLLAIFGTYGEVPEITKEPGMERSFGLFMEIEEILEKKRGCPAEIITLLKQLTKRLLAIKPGERPLPSPIILQTDLDACHDWYEVSASAAQLDKTVARGSHSYWFGLDMNVLQSLHQEYCKREKARKDSRFTGETLFGMAEASSQQPIANRNTLVLKYILASAKKGFVPARAICGKVYEALDVQLDVDEPTIQIWNREAVKDGYLFNYHGFMIPNPFSQERYQFRSNGGHAEDPFLDQQQLLRVANDTSRLKKWLETNDVNTVVDSVGNTIMHVCAALGQVTSLELLLSQSSLEPVNEKGETPLYKGCQAGHTNAVVFLLGKGHSTTTSNPRSPSPLHWLFMFPRNDTESITGALIKAGAEVNTVIKPQRQSHRSQRSPMKHYPFEWPHGTALHWASFARNKVAMDVLLSTGADINATYDDGSYATTPLALAVFTGDVPVVKYLLSKGADARFKTKQDENLLHIMTIGGGNDDTIAGRKFDSWVRHGAFHNRVEATREIIRLLVDAGVDMEARATTYGKHTPLLAAASGGFRKEYVVLALIQEGADVNATTVSDDDVSLLYKWCRVSPETLQYPHVYEQIFKEIVARTNDLEQKGGSLDGPPLHEVVQKDVPTEQWLSAIRILLDDPSHRADVNATDRDGDTALIKLCLTSPDGMLEKLKFLLDAGAKPDIANDYQENFILRLVSNYTLMDADSLSAMKFLISQKTFTPTVLSSFIATIDLSAFVSAATSGRLETLSYLLSIGFTKFINTPVTQNNTEMTILDATIFAADSARLTYITHFSSLATNAVPSPDIEPTLYTTNAYIRLTYGGPSPARAREAYWAFPAIIRLLLSHGAKRIAQTLQSGPSWTDAVSLPILHLNCATQPHREHWSVLYECEELKPGWEDDAWDMFKEEWGEAVGLGNDEYDEDEGGKPDIDVPVMVFERWPRVREVLGEERGKEGWWKAVMRDGRKVEVQVGDEGVLGVRDARGRMLGKDVR